MCVIDGVKQQYYMFNINIEDKPMNLLKHINLHVANILFNIAVNIVLQC
jgi:hypothetical protein